ncbi:hypothetical protein EVAR_74754_1 [Eumeta japonica]|uniref:Uncharacterized protein n=1 Tax=Eumeta variegata TaxID=151549 RepID=A0A4C1SPW7_EUMVA|nr:hypothetical protein EVAR_74754_1 [Eumeta japonica]
MEEGVEWPTHPLSRRVGHRNSLTGRNSTNNKAVAYRLYSVRVEPAHFRAADKFITARLYHNMTSNFLEIHIKMWRLDVNQKKNLRTINIALHVVARNVGAWCGAAAAAGADATLQRRPLCPRGAECPRCVPSAPRARGRRAPALRRRVRARLITNVKCYRTQPPRRTAPLRTAAPKPVDGRLSAIAWPYRWLFALTECGEQRSPAARLCARAAEHTAARSTQAPRRCAGAFRNRSLFYLCEGVVSPRTPYNGLAGPGPARGAGREEFRGGGRIVNCYEVDFAPEIPK